MVGGAVDSSLMDNMIPEFQHLARGKAPAKPSPLPRAQVQHLHIATTQTRSMVPQTQTFAPDIIPPSNEPVIPLHSVSVFASTSAYASAPPLAPVAPSSSLSASASASRMPSAPPQYPNAQNDLPRSHEHLFISVYGKRLQPSCKVMHIMRDCLKLQTDLDGYTLKNVSQRIASFYWREFKKRCDWDEAIDGLVKKFYPSMLMRAYRNFVYDVKNSAVCPPYISDDVYNKWKEHWEPAAGKHKSLKGKLARRGGDIDGPMLCHTCGSILLVEHADRLMKRKVEPHELFLYTHTKDHDGVTFIDDRSRIINERVLEMRDQLPQVADKVLYKRMLYFEAIGGFNKKARIAGLGDGSTFYTSQTRSSFASNSYQDGSACGSGISQIPQIQSQMKHVEEAIEGIIAAQQNDRICHDKRFEAVLGEVRNLKYDIDAIRSEISNILHGMRNK